MEPTITALILCILAWLLYKFWNHIISTKYNNLPPGPKGLPFVGNAFQLDPSGSHKTLTAWRHIYGDVFRVKVFQKNMVVLNDYASIYEMLVTKTLQFADRPYTYRANEVLSSGYEAVTFENYSPQWNLKKKMYTKSVRAYGEGRKVLEELAVRFINKMIVRIDEESGESFDVKPMLHLCTAGIITSLLYGQELNDSLLLELLERQDALFKFLAPTGIEVLLDICPALRYLPIPAFKMGDRVSKEFSQSILNMYQSWKKESQLGKIECVAQDWVEMEKEGKLTDNEIKGLHISMVTAGSITTTKTLYSLFGVFIGHKDVQDKMYEEIQRVTYGRKPTLDDRKEMHYTEATIEEITRFATIIPFLVPHLCREDTTLSGFDMPKGTQILPNIWALHHDPEHWDEPEKFKPERFLDEDGKLVDANHEKRKLLMQFGRGRRSCPGEQFARNRIYLMVSHLVQEFEFLPENPDDFPDMDPGTYQAGLVLTPQPYKMRVKRRGEE